MSGTAVRTELTFSLIFNPSHDHAADGTFDLATGRLTAGEGNAAPPAEPASRASTSRRPRDVRLTARDRLDPDRVTEMEYISLDSVPTDYAIAMRQAWLPEASKGVYLSISKARTPEWVQENVDNSLRAWDGREGISSRTYKKALTAWKASTRPIREVLPATMNDADRRKDLTELGEAFAQAFNVVAGPEHLLVTEERDGCSRRRSTDSSPTRRVTAPSIRRKQR